MQYVVLVAHAATRQLDNKFANGSTLHHRGRRLPFNPNAERRDLAHLGADQRVGHVNVRGAQSRGARPAPDAHAVYGAHAKLVGGGRQEAFNELQALVARCRQIVPKVISGAHAPL